MLLPGSRQQLQLDDFLDFSGTIAVGGTPQLLLPQQPRRAYLLFQNTSSANLVLEIGPARATATISGGQVTGISVANAGLGYTVAPLVQVLGGLTTGDYQSAPSNVASATAAISGGAVSSITVSNPGAGYLVAPTIFLLNPLPSLGGGAAIPAATTGIVVAAGGTFLMDSTAVVTSAVAVFGATLAQSFTVKTIVL